MTQEKIIKAKSNKLNKPEDGNFGKNFNYVCEQHSVEVCFRDGFFDTLAGNFMAGDNISCLHIIDNILLATCEARVVFVDQDAVKTAKVEVHKASEIMSFGKIPESIIEKELPGPEYIKKDGVAIYNKKKRTYEVWMDDKIVCDSRNKKYAEEIARGDRPLPGIVLKELEKNA